ncbi:MAG: EFR1 family ferrodoxin [Deltaproteobacteria bacterium]|nr:EFR1 family ferrodoxin [Deltaproteobacteria bacterium]
MAYQRAVVYFASGTGNSYRTAVWMAAVAEAQGADALSIPIEKAVVAQEVEPGPSQLVGFSYPTHGFMPPWSMIKFLLRLPRGRGSHAVVVAGRGCIKLGPLFVPGIAGLATVLAGLILAAKGFSPRGGLGLDMPANMLNLHWGLHPDNVRAINERAKGTTERFMKQIVAGKLRWLTLNHLWELSWGALLCVVWPLFFPIYLFFARVFMGKLFFADRDCNGCGLCAKTCPNDAIKMIGKERPTPFWTHACEACIRCMAYCQRRAIQTSQPWTVLVVYLTTLATAEALERGVLWATGTVVALPGIVGEVASVVAGYGIVIALYYGYWLLSRFGPTRVLLTYSTPTRYYRRFHEPDTRITDMTRHPLERRAKK